jgi:hypothetical protein
MVIQLPAICKHCNQPITKRIERGLDKIVLLAAILPRIRYDNEWDEPQRCIECNRFNFKERM